MKGFLRTVLHGAGIAIGLLLGKWVWNALTNPVSKAKAKKKFKDVKDAICKKD